jgi:dTDP-4-amino-4,6-dideoxygalactose transaminase
MAVRSLRAEGSPVDRPAHAGGTPVRSAFLPFHRVELGVAEENAVLETLRSGWIGTGPRTERFERAFALAIGTEHAVGVSSCTAGLHLLLRAFGVEPGDEVITSAMTFPGTANAVLHAGARPVFADVLPGRLTLDPSSVEAVVSSRTRAILPVHLAGWPCEMDELRSIARRVGAALVEDAAHALGATYRGKHAGALGDGAAFSFYATKSVTTAEGGMITTDREDLVPRMKRERLHGLDLDASQRDGLAYRHWEAVSIGWKYNLNDLQAALGLAQLEQFPDVLARRRRLDARYRERLTALPAFDPLEGPEGAESAAHLFPVLIRPGALEIDRDTLLSALLAENIGVGIHFRALPLHRHFREAVGTAPEAVPVSTDASSRILSLPLYPALSDADLDDVVTALERIAWYYAA